MSIQSSAVTLNVNISSSSITLNINIGGISEPTASIPALFKIGTQKIVHYYGSGPVSSTIYSVPTGKTGYLIYAGLASWTVSGGSGTSLVLSIGGTLYTVLTCPKDSSATASGLIAKLNAGDSVRCVVDSGQNGECDITVVEV
ncbi:MAG: hypothetical protein QXF50_02420 [Sulfolobales archaeon]